MQEQTQSECSHRLFWFDELPRVLQYNKYVRSGYRAGELTRRHLPLACGDVMNAQLAG